MTQSVNIVAKAMKEHCGADEQKIKHFVSVYTLAKTIGELEKLPAQTQEYLEIASLVCDIDASDSSKESATQALLSSLSIDSDIVERVCYIVAHYSDFDHITGLDHQILLEAHMIVDFKEQGTDRAQIINCANTRFMTNYGKAFLKKAFGI